MHITAWKNDLMEVLSVVSRALPVKSPIDSIKGILLDAGEDLTFIANNLEFAIKGTTNAEVWEEGKVVLPAKFIDIIRYLPNTQIEIKVDNLNAEIKSGNSTFNLRCIDPEEFPANTPLTEANTLQLESEQLKRILARTVFATSFDDTKPCFKGLLMEMQEGKLVTLATDTYRLAKITEEGFEENEDFRIVIPGKNIIELQKILEDGTVTLYFNKSEMIAVYKQYTFYYRLLQDEYPDLRNVFPEDFDVKITVNAELEQVLSRAAIVVPDNKTIALKITNNVLNIFAKSDSGEMSEDIPVEAANGKQLDEVFFNVKFIQDVLKNLKGNIDIAFKASPGPCVFFDNNYKYLVLPVAKKK